MKFELDVDGIGDLLAALHGVGMAGEQLVHLLRAADVELVAVELEAIRVVARPAGVDAQQDVMRDAVFLPQIMGVAGRHQRQTELVGDVDGPLGTELLDLQAVVLDLDEEPFLEDPGEILRQLPGLVHAVFEDEVAELGGGAPAETDDALAARLQQLLVDARLVVVAFEERQRRHLDEVLKPGRVLRQQSEMMVDGVVGFGVAFARFAVGALGRGDVGFIADDRIEAGGLAFLVELDGAEEIAVIRQGDGGHALLFDMGDEFGNAAGSVEQAVMAVAVEMHERTLGHR